MSARPMRETPSTAPNGSSPESTRRPVGPKEGPKTVTEPSCRSTASARSRALHRTSNFVPVTMTVKGPAATRHAAERKHLRTIFAGGYVSNRLAFRAHGAAFRPEMTVGVNF